MVKGYHEQKAYIATQAPLPDTVDDFWMMVWEQKCATIVMLTKEMEGGRVKSHKYWPEKGVSHSSALQVIHISETDYPDYVTRVFKLVDTLVGAVLQYALWVLD